MSWRITELLQHIVEQNSMETRSVAETHQRQLANLSMLSEFSPIPLNRREDEYLMDTELSLAEIARNTEVQEHCPSDEVKSLHRVRIILGVWDLWRKQ